MKIKEEKKSSPYRGVSWDAWRKAWKARIGVNGATLTLGYFERSLDAAKAFNQVAEKYACRYRNVLPE